MLVKWLMGYRLAECDRGAGIRVLNVMMRNNIEYWGLKRGADGEYIFSLLEKDYKKLLSLLDKYQLRVYSVKGRGLPFVCKAHKNRVGLIVGSIIFMIIIFLSSLFIWDVEIVSDTDIPHNEILANLKELGCYEGAFVPSIDFENLCIDYAAQYKNCSWISVNLRGTVAYVEIRDRQLYQRAESTPANLVASRSGIIEGYSVYSGRAHVTSGDVVKKGDLLVSGIVESKHGVLRLCRADGEVNAIVDTVLRVEVPYSSQKQVYTGRSYEKSVLRFFNFELPLFSSEPDEDCLYTTSRESGAVVLFDKIELPLSIEKEVFCEYTVEEFTYTHSEAEKVADTMMDDKFRQELPSAQLISVTSSGEHTEDGYILECRVRCRMNIAEHRDINIIN